MLQKYSLAYVIVSAIIKGLDVITLCLKKRPHLWLTIILAYMIRLR